MPPQEIKHKKWWDDCRVVKLKTGNLAAIPIGLAESNTDYQPGMSEAATKANEIIRNMMRVV